MEHRAHIFKAQLEALAERFGGKVWLADEGMYLMVDAVAISLKDLSLPLARVTAARERIEFYSNLKDK